MDGFSWQNTRKVTKSILTKRKCPTDEDLFVFGYSCKLYKDDEKARLINSGRHLIPWMGQPSLMIDRYDARGYLNDLSQCDSQNTKSMILSADELELENRLNAERFADLEDEDSDNDSKSIDDSKVYSRVNYQYDEGKRETKVETDQEENDRFIAPSGLNLPTDLATPKSNKHHQIIEKTALFVAEQGPQMEILLKTKQASNSAFNFLSIDSELHPYFKFLVSQIKARKYIPEQNNDSKSDNDDDDNDGSYLHPSLLSSNAKQKLKIPSLFSAKQVNDSYSLLVKNFKDKFGYELSPEREDSVPKEDTDSNNESKVDISSLIPKPTPEMEVIITKLAQHVAKNGESFENSIKDLNDKKFEFLINGHTYHPYYVQQKIRYLNEAKKEKIKNKAANQKLIAFSISSKLKNNSSKVKITDLEASNVLEEESTHSVESTVISKEKQLQEERRRKAHNFLKMLQKENKLDDFPSQIYGPNLPNQVHKIELSPTIEAVTSPPNSPKLDDFDPDELLELPLKFEKPKTSQSLLPFTFSDDKIKTVSRSRSRSPSPKRKSSNFNIHSPPQRYRSADSDRKHSRHKKKSRKHRDRSSSRESRRRTKSKLHKSRKHRSRRYSSSSRSPSNSLSPSPRRRSRYSRSRSKSRS